MKTIAAVFALLASSAVAHAQLIIPTDFKGHTDEVTSVAFTPDGKSIVSGSMDGTVKLWDIKTEKLVRTFEGHESRVFAVNAWQDKTKKRLVIVSGGQDNKIILWDGNSGKALRTIAESKESINTLQFMKDGWRFVANNNRSVQFWHMTNDSDYDPLVGHKDVVNSVSVSPDGKNLASGGCDKLIFLWEDKEEEPIKEIKGHTDWVRCVSYSPDGKFLASASKDESIRIWDVATGKSVKVIANAHAGGAFWVSWSPDGKQLATSGEDSAIRLWNTSTWASAGALTRHEKIVYAVVYSPDGKYLVSAGGDNLVKLWEIR